MLISVILPVFNGSNYLKSAIDSILIQKEVLEVIIINDCSTDNTLDIIKAEMAKSDKIRYYKTTQRKGPAHARNIGLRAVKGKYFTFLDHDDYYLENRFKASLQILENNEQIDGTYDITENEFIKKNTVTISTRFYKLAEPISSDKLFHYLISETGIYFAMPSIVLKAFAIEKVGYFDENLLYAEDIDYIYRLALHLNLSSSGNDAPMIIRRIHGKNMTEQKDYVNSIKRKKLVSKWFRVMLDQNWSKDINRIIFRRYLSVNTPLNYSFPARIIYKTYYSILSFIKFPKLLKKITTQVSKKIPN